MRSKFVEIGVDGAFVCDAPFATGSSSTLAPLVGDDGSMPDGMCSPKWTGVWDDVAKEWKNGGWVEGDPVAADLAKQQANIAAIKAKAGEIITARLPEWKQRNLLARKAELQDKKLAGVVYTAAEKKELAFMAAEWTWAVSVREISNVAEKSNIPVEQIVWPI